MTVAELIAELQKLPPDIPVFYVETGDLGTCYIRPAVRVSKMLETDRVALHEFPCDPAVNLSPPYFNAALIDSEQ